ncbi:MAG: indolepyruvate--methylviologen oxidoreductase subunit c [Blastococcus sp.]|jgi:aerobic-type carbon monoxide dehydrogenase small subunit (CoxS/CutS family)|nr:indolepyruvate--methylviologen oxidoreductase subunit c [Blastococcus sp.]
MAEPRTEFAISVEVNGTTVERTVESRSLLIDFLRSDLALTGTKVSCELQVCGVCTVLVDGRPVSSCTYLTVDADGRSVTTVESLSSGGKLHPLQEAFVDCHALQCGFCTPGFLMMAKGLLDANPGAEREEIVEHLEGNICRCTGYRPIVEAVESVARQQRAEAK